MAFVLDVKRLRMLLAVAEYGGVAAAARALSFTPPAVSQQLAALERQLGVSLVDRSGRTAVLTLPGRRLAEHAQELLAGLEAAEADVTALAHPDGAAQGILTIATIPTLGRALLPGVLAQLACTAPQLDLRIEQLEPEDSLPRLARGDLDLALAGEFALTPRRLHGTLERRDLFAEPVHIAVAANHRLLGPQVQLSDLREDRWISPAPTTSCAVLLERSCAIAGYEPHIVAHCADFDLAAALTAAGHGVTLLPDVAVPQDLVSPANYSGDRPTLRLLTTTVPSTDRTVYAVTRRGAHLDPALAALLAVLDEQVEALKFRLQASR